MFPWGRKHTFRVILSPLENFEFLGKSEISTCPDPRYGVRVIGCAVENVQKNGQNGSYGLNLKKSSNLISNSKSTVKITRENNFELPTTNFKFLIFNLGASYQWSS